MLLALYFVCMFVVVTSHYSVHIAYVLPTNMPYMYVRHTSPQLMVGGILRYTQHCTAVLSSMALQYNNFTLLGWLTKLVVDGVTWDCAITCH